MLGTPHGIRRGTLLPNLRVGIGEHKADVFVWVLFLDELMFLSVSRDKPAFGFHDDTVGKNEVRGVLGWLLRFGVLNHLFFI